MVSNADVTIYRKTGRDKATRADIWQRTVYNGVQLHGTQGTDVADKSREAKNAWTLRVFTQGPAPCRVGDIVVCSVCTAPTPAAAREAEEIHFTVAGITDNRRGSPRMQHWTLLGE